MPAGEPRLTRNWQRFFYFVVIVDLVAVGAGLYFAYRVTNVVEASIAANKMSALRRERYLELGRLASAVDAPGNDVFASGDPVAEERRLTEAQAVFERALDAARAELSNSAPGPARDAMLNHLGSVKKSSAEMVAEGHRLLQHFRRGEQELAGQRMAAMDRHYADLNVAITNLRSNAIASEIASLDLEAREARSLQGYQGVIAAAILLMIAASGIYGHKLSARAQAHQIEREGYIARLRESEATLEQRVLERTQALRTTEERLRLAGRATNDALWDWDIHTDSIWWNDAFHSLFGHSATQPTFAFRMALVHPEDAERVATGLRQFLEQGGDVWRAEYRVRRANGSYAWVLDRGYAVRDAGGRPRRVIGAMMDITDRKEAERMKSDFVSFVSHQLRTPLAGMSWMLELAGRQRGAARHGARVHRRGAGVRRAARLAGERSPRRREARERTHCVLARKCRAGRADRQRRTGDERPDCGAEPRRARAPAVSGSGGLGRCAAGSPGCHESAVERREVHTAGRPDRRHAARPEGHGAVDGRRQRRRHPPGRPGPSVRALLPGRERRRHGSGRHRSRTPSRSSDRRAGWRTCVVRIGRRTRRAVLVHAAGRTGRSAGLMTRSRRVLLVEDDRFLRRACEASLRQRGFDVTTASEGDEGLRLARTEPYPDIVLLDLLMPKLPGSRCCGRCAPIRRRPGFPY